MNETMLTILKDGGEAAREKNRELMELYQEEFGLNWVYKELSEARDHIEKNIRWIKGGNKQNRTFGTIQIIFEKLDKELPGNDTCFIGIREVCHWQLIAYSKGLYWMAGHDLINN